MSRGLWVKMRIDLPEDVDVISTAERLDVTENEVLGGLLRILGWFNRESRDGRVTGVTPAWLNRHARVTHPSRARHEDLCAELVRVGWLRVENGEVFLTNYDRHNGKIGKSRAQSAERSKTYRKRKRHAAVTQPVTQPSRCARDLEKEREEEYLGGGIPLKPPPPPPPTPAGGKQKTPRRVRAPRGRTMDEFDRRLEEKLSDTPTEER